VKSPTVPTATINIESVLRAEIETQERINQGLRLDLEVQKERADHWRDAVLWAYETSREALMMPIALPIEARKAREQALCDINKKLGGLVR
jgi:hypothetical protein